MQLIKNMTSCKECSMDKVTEVNHSSTARQMAEIFDAKSIAIVGASADPGKAGYQVLKTLLTMGYQGQVFAVNPKESEILGVACHTSILDIPSRLDLLVISLPAIHAVGAMKQAAQRGDIQGAIVLSAGFSETAVPEWVEAERELVRIAKSAGIRVFGPNCLGIFNCEFPALDQLCSRGLLLRRVRSATYHRAGPPGAPS